MSTKLEDYFKYSGMQVMSKRMQAIAIMHCYLGTVQNFLLGGRGGPFLEKCP